MIYDDLKKHTPFSSFLDGKNTVNNTYNRKYVLIVDVIVRLLVNRLWVVRFWGSEEFDTDFWLCRCQCSKPLHSAKVTYTVFEGRMMATLRNKGLGGKSWGDKNGVQIIFCLLTCVKVNSCIYFVNTHEAVLHDLGTYDLGTFKCYASIKKMYLSEEAWGHVIPPPVPFSIPFVFNWCSLCVCWTNVWKGKGILMQELKIIL